MLAHESYSPLQRLSNFFQRITTIQNVMPFFFGEHTQECTITAPLQKLIHTIEALQLHRSLPADGQFLGRKRADRLTLAHCFIAKCVLNTPTTKALIERLQIDPTLRRIVGYERKKDIPNESTFSRAFAEFSTIELFQRNLATFIQTHQGDALIDNLNRDATALEAREKADKQRMEELKNAKLAKQKTPAKKRGRPRKNTPNNSETTATPEAGKEAASAPAKAHTIIEKQRHQTLAENLRGLSTVCDIGTKCNAQGFKNSWKGYKLHLDTTTEGLPISAIVTSASVHDSQCAIPLTQMSKERVTNLYDIMDAGYCSEALRDYSREQGHVPLIDHNARRGEKREFLDFEAERYKARSGSERANGRLKDEYGLRNIRVKGHSKVTCHVMIGIVCLAADVLLRMSQ